jgi:amino acid adenylation domain-containing protein
MNIAPKQIDEVLESHPTVLEAAAVGVPDRYVGEDLVAFVVLRAGATCHEKELLSYCEGHLGHFKTPTRIHFVQDLPKGPSGKVQRLRLVEEASRPAMARSVTLGSSAGTTAAGSSSSGASELPIEQDIAEIWADLLAQPKIDAQANFFALGGHSLLAIQCLSRLREKVPVMLSLSDFFENATVAQQAALVRKRLMSAPAQESNGQMPIDSPPVPPRDRTIPCPLSPAQKRIWFFEQLMPGVPLYNESEAVRLRGDLNVDALEQALNVVITRHEILRSTIEAKDGQPLVVVHESWPLRLKKVDVSTLGAAQRQGEVERLLIDEPGRPYHLESEPGIRATLVRLGSQEHVLILMMHHLVCDWSSIGVFWREMSAAYRAFSQGEGVVLSPLPIQHGDYAAWQHQQMTETSFAKDLAFWEKTLRGAPELLELPTDRPRPPAISYRGARQRFRLDTPLVDSLRECSRREKVSLFTVFTAALDALLYRYTGQEDVLLGIPLADRARPEVQPLIGFLLHTQVLRTRLTGEMTYRELLAPVQKGVLDLYSHGTVPFDQVVNRLQPVRNLGYSPLFQVMVNWRDCDQLLSFIGMDGLEIESLLAESRTSKFDLTMTLTDCGEEVWLEMEYSTDLFDDNRIARMVGHYQTLLEAAAAGPDTRIGDLPVLTQAERNQILVEWNRTEVAYPKYRCLHQLIEEQVRRTPEAVAVVFEGKKLTYGELNGRANQLARHLQKLGVGPDCLVGVCAERSLEMVIGLLGILKAGGAYVPMDPEYPKDRLAFMLEDSSVKVLLTQGKLADSLPKCNARRTRLDTDWPLIEGESQADVERRVSAEHLAYMIYTSGSTGKPKGAMNTHQGIVNRLLWMQDAYQLTAADRVLQKTPFSFDVSVWEFFWPLLAGAKLVVARPGGHRDGAYLAQLIEREKITTVHFVPSMLQAFLEQEGLRESCSSLKRVICSGEALPMEYQRRFFSVIGAELHNLYGPTEASVDVTYWACPRESRMSTVPIGRPIANTRIYILDRRLQPVPAGVAGELHIGGVGLARGYHNRPELTAEKFVGDPFSGEPGARLYKTGDLARHLPDGNIEYLGRLDHQVKIHGFRIELGEIETVLNQHPEVQSSVVVVREDKPGDKRLVAYLANRNGGANPVEMRQWLGARLPEYMVPAAFVALDALPLSPNGKVDRKALPAPDFGSAADKNEYVSPRTETEATVAKIWSELLGVKQIGVKDNFFALGGHSLQATRLQARMEKELGQKLPLAALFQHPTIEGLAAALSPQTEKGRRPELIRLSSNSRGPSLILLIGPGSFELFNLGDLLKADAAVYAAIAPLPESVIIASTERRSAETPSMEELAAVQAALIKEKAPEGPLLLTGYCFRGVLAFETARQLQSAGREVAGVVLLDTWMHRPSRLWWKKTWFLGHARTTLQKGPLYVWRKFHSRIEFERNRVADERKLTQRGDFSGEVPWVVTERIYLEAMARYSPKPLDCRCVVIAPQDDLWVRAYKRRDPSLGARDMFKGGVEVLGVPGNHLHTLSRENQEELARAYKTALKILCPQPMPIAPTAQAPTAHNATARDSLSVRLMRAHPTSPIPGPPLFLIPGQNGTGTFPSAFVRRIGSLRLCQDGLEYPGLRGPDPPLRRMEDIASQLIVQIQKRSPRGPYGLCGFSFGGLMAYEIACQMRNRGLEVDALVLWDACLPQSTVHYRRTFREAMAELVVRLKRRDRAGRTRMLWQLVGTKWSASSQRLRRYFGWLALESPRELVAKASIEAWRNYVPKPYNGDAVVFQAQELGGIFNGSKIIQGLDWSDLIKGKLDVIELPGNHLNVWEEPGFSVLARKTADWLQRQSDKETETEIPSEESFEENNRLAQTHHAIKA